MTFVRMFNHKLLDMLELYLDPESFRTISQFKTLKAATGLKPLLAFSGTLFDSPTPNAYTLARSLFLDLFKGHDAISVDVEALQYMIHIAAGEEVDATITDDSFTSVSDHYKKKRPKVTKSGA